MACFSGCNHQAIIMTEDVCGFVYPVIQEDKCVNCGVCMAVCPVNHPVTNSPSVTVYATYSKDDADRMSSTSGGASSVMAQCIIRQGGVVYGCVQQSYETTEHVRIEEGKELYKIKGSKYVQSNIGDIFRQVKKDLSSGKQVLFTGTPCQIAGLRSFLRKDYAGLVTVDLVCHGVPSARLLKEHMQEILERKKLQGKAYKVYFRTKGEHESDLKYGIFLNDVKGKSTEDIVVAIEYPRDYYITGFMCGLFHRACCYSCSYASPHRISDITIGDYWGIGETVLSTERGISAVLLNTEKGIHFFELCKDELVYEEREVLEAVRGNGQLQHPSVKNKNCEQFRRLYPRLGFSGAARRCLYSFYIDYYITARLKRVLKRIPFVYNFYRIIKK